MKKIFVKPEIQVMKMAAESSVLAGSAGTLNGSYTNADQLGRENNGLFGNDVPEDDNNVW